MSKVYSDCRQPTETIQKHDNQAFQQMLLDHVTDPMWLKGVDGRYLAVNEAYARTRNFNKVFDIGKTDHEIYEPERAKQNIAEDATVQFAGEVLRVEREVSIDRGVQKRWYDIVKAPVFDSQGNLVGIAGVARDVTDNRRRKEKIIRQNRLMKALQKIAIDLMKRRGINELLPDILHKAGQIVQVSFGFLYVLDKETDTMKLRCHYGSRKNVRTEGYCMRPRGQALVGHVWETKKNLYIDDYSVWEHRIKNEYWDNVHAVIAIPLFAGEEVIGVLSLGHVEPAKKFSREDISALDQFATLASVAIDNACLFTKYESELEHRCKAERELKSSEERYRAIMQQSSDAIVLSEPDTARLIEANHRFYELSGYSQEDLARLTSYDLAETGSGHLVSHYINSVKDKGALAPSLRRLKRKDRTLVNVERTSSLVCFGNKQLIMTNLRDITERRHNKFLQFMQQTTLDIIGHLHKEKLLNEIVVRATQLVDAPIGFCVIDGDGGLVVKAEVGSGLNLNDRGSSVFAKQGLVEMVWQEGKPLIVHDYAAWESRLDTYSDWGSVAGFPLKDTSRNVVGVLCLAHQDKSRHFREEEIYYLQQFAHFASLALVNAHLYQTIEQELTERKKTELMLQTAYEELDQTYSTTLEGWARALDLRDCETEGHSRRVASLAVQMARAMNVSSEQLIHYWRGGLLHDVGKLGVPDSILMKPGKLTPDEWEIMRNHTQYGYGWLLPIKYLHPCLDIPLYHHERWDGTGYPKGLRGEAIPLAARIFAVADVWDALRSDRPYRKGWPEMEVRNHIREGAGSHFDPIVVDVFLNLPTEAFKSGEVVPQRQPHSGCANR